MPTVFRRGFLASIALTIVAIHGGELSAQQSRETDGAGIIWIVGTVKLNGRAPTIDLGDVHAFHEGDEATVFRPGDSHFIPLGTIRSRESYAIWSIPETPKKFELQENDRIMFVRTLSQMGTGESFRDDFLRRQLVRTEDRNGYSTVLLENEADALQRFVARQPRWEKAQKHVSGTIRAESLSRTDVQEMQPLLNQIMRLQEFRTLGVPVEAAMGPAWEAVLKTLTPVQVGPVASRETVDELLADEKLKSDAAELGVQMKAVLEKKIGSIRRHVEKVHYARSIEERNSITVLCVTLEVLGLLAEKNKSIVAPRNERQWFELQLRKTQFPGEAESQTLLDEMAAIIRSVRAEE